MRYFYGTPLILYLAFLENVRKNLFGSISNNIIYFSSFLFFKDETIHRHSISNLKHSQLFLQILQTNNIL